MNVVFVCTGNTCRSPMAEGIFKVLLKEHSISDINCTSCGLAACSGEPASNYAVEAAAVYNADISSHRSRALSRYLIDETDLFVCMTSSHLSALSPFVPSDKLMLLSDKGIADPFMGTREDYALCAEQIRNSLEELIKTIGADKNE